MESWHIMNGSRRVPGVVGGGIRTISGVFTSASSNGLSEAYGTAPAWFDDNQEWEDGSATERSVRYKPRRKWTKDYHVKPESKLKPIRGLGVVRRAAYDGSGTSSTTFAGRPMTLVTVDTVIRDCLARLTYIVTTA
ncbi:hypothetical protein DL546_001246 [Coniochaeta pulveracea]|uniref:Uncharacterized protein n=1 Tax=Coniochaeta pulveracea TaxID=177199 RepID=A0A420Y5Q5_9PEZI|nr:hypothetical protein DL546_001246 [Coniochaeta pulveracea]